MITNICILGERTSGTTFIQALISSNTDVKFNSSFGHKHFRQDIDKIEKTDTSQILFIFITRDVLQWLQSLNVNTFHADLPLRRCTDFSKFIRMEWKCIEDETSGVSQLDKKYGQEMMYERDPITGERFSNAIKMRTSKIQHYLVDVSSKVEHFEHVRYESVRDDPQEWLRKICEKYYIRLKPKFVPITSVRGKGRVQYSVKEYPEICKEDQEYILNEICIETEEYIGYL